MVNNMDKSEWIEDWSGEGTPEGYQEYIYQDLIEMTSFLNITPEQMDETLQMRLDRTGELHVSVSDIEDARNYYGGNMRDRRYSGECKSFVKYGYDLDDCCTSCHNVDTLMEDETKTEWFYCCCGVVEWLKENKIQLSELDSIADLKESGE